MIHELKTWPEYFIAVWAGDKMFEIRKDDRGFQPGDTLHLYEYDPKSEIYSGRYIVAKVGFVLVDTEIGLQEGYCIMSLTETANFHDTAE